MKTTMRYYLTLVRMTIIKMSEIINAGEGLEKQKKSYTGVCVCVCVCKYKD